MICSADRCERPSFCKGLCTKHYQRFYTHGSVTVINRRENGQGTIHHGYKEITVKGKQVPEHRNLIEVFLGRKLQRREVIHHINGDRLDNRLENLMILTNQTHTPIHKTGRYWHKGTSDTHKYCSKCEQVKPRIAFSITKSPSWCIICTRHYYHHYVKTCPLCNL